MLLLKMQLILEVVVNGPTVMNFGAMEQLGLLVELDVDVTTGPMLRQLL